MLRGNQLHSEYYWRLTPRQFLMWSSVALLSPRFILTSWCHDVTRHLHCFSRVSLLTTTAEVVFCWQTILLLLNMNKEYFSTFLSSYPTWAPGDRCLCTFSASFSMDVIVLHYYVHCLRYYRIPLYSFIAILYRLLYLSLSSDVPSYSVSVCPSPDHGHSSLFAPSHQQEVVFITRCGMTSLICAP